MSTATPLGRTELAVARRLLFYEAGSAPTTRSVRELGTLARAGWDITVAHAPAATGAVEALGYRSLLLPEPAPNPFVQRLAARLADLDERGQHLTAEINKLSESVRAQRAKVATDEDRTRVTLERASLEALKAERSAVAAQKRAIQAARRHHNASNGRNTLRRSR